MENQNNSIEGKKYKHPKEFEQTTNDHIDIQGAYTYDLDCPVKPVIISQSDRLARLNYEEVGLMIRQFYKSDFNNLPLKLRDYVKLEGVDGIVNIHIHPLDPNVVMITGTLIKYLDEQHYKYCAEV